MAKQMTRGNQDAYTGYGASWTQLRKAPYAWAKSCLEARDKAFFNFEHEESAAQPNWELARKEPWYEVPSYEWGYEEGSIGRKLAANEWRASQAFQTFSAWESMKKQILLGYDGFSWCSLESGANMFTYQKPLVDAFGVPKLAFYANRQVFERIWAASDNVDVVYGPDDCIQPIIFNLDEPCTADLTIELGFSSDMGVTNDRYPLEVAEGQSQMIGYSHYGIQISTQDMEHVDFYLHALGVPARRDVNDPVVKQGEQAFYKARCDLCHVPTLHTRQDAPSLINGTRLPWLASQTIHPYSDFLLHDMGPELDSHYTSGLAMGCEWRTTPLWGIGLQYKVNQHTYFLHDGRARNLKEAILWHGGEGAVSREIFKNMPREERDALIRFLESF